MRSYACCWGDAMTDLYHLLRAVPRAVAFYHGSPTLAARRAFRVLRREGIGGIRRRVFILLGGLGSASAGATELYGDFPKENEEFQPKVSVIVPNYNHAPYLRQRLDSIYQQTYQNMEVILLDDCSSDASVEILMEYAQRFPDRTICRFNDANSGSVFQQWKKGLEIAGGELVWIAESDDFCAGNFLAEQVRAFQNSAVRLSFCKTKFVAGEPAEEAWTLDYHLSDLNLADFSRSFVRSAHSLVRDGWAVKNIVPNVSGAVFRHPGNLPLLDDPRWLGMRMCGDWVFYLSLIRGGLVAYTADTVNYYRQHERSTSQACQKTDLYYAEHEVVASYLVEFFRLDRSVLDKQDALLYHHWCSQRGSALRSDYRRLYDPARAIAKSAAKRRPNVLMAVYALIAGGGETFPILLANQLFQRGYAVTLLNCLEHPTEPGVQKMLDSRIPLLELPRLELVGAVVSDMGIELVHSHHAWVDLTLASLLIGKSDTKQLVTMHGMYEMMTPEQRASLMPLLSSRVDRFVFTAEKNLTVFPGDFQREKNFTRINNALPSSLINPVDRGSLQIGQDDFVLCMVARGIPEKGWEEAIQSVNWANAHSVRNIHLVLIGDGPELDRLRSTHSSECVHFLGYRQNIRDYFAASDMGFLPSRFQGESAPLVVIDCLFAGKPVLASDIGEIREMLDTPEGLAGQVFPLRDWSLNPEEIGQEIVDLANQPSLYNALLAKVPAAAHKFEMDAMVDRYEAVYRDTIPLDDDLRNRMTPSQAASVRGGQVSGLLRSRLRWLAGGIRALRGVFNRLSDRIPPLRQAKIERIRQSPLFDADFYVDRNPDVAASGVDLAEHYALSGWKEYRNPSAEFSTRRYLQANPDVAAVGVNPLLHYINQGKTEGRQIYSVDIEEGAQIEAIRASGLFDADYYFATYTDIQPPPQDPIRHYCERGWREGRNPSAEFDTRGYLAAYADIKGAGTNPFWHYVVAGRAELRHANPERARKRRIEAEVEAIRDSGLFDADYYLATYPDIQPPPQDPLHHYCEYGWHEGRNPSEEFDTQYYLEAYSDIKDTGINPFWHYVVAGRAETRAVRKEIVDRYEDDVYFGELSSDVRLIAYYAHPDWAAMQQAGNSVKGSDRAITPHEDLGCYEVGEPGLLVRQAKMARCHGVSAWCFTVDAARGTAHGEALRGLLSNREVDIGFILDVDLRASHMDEELHALLASALKDERYLRIEERPVLVMTLPGDEHQCGEVMTAFDAFLDRVPNPYRIVRFADSPTQAVAAASCDKFDAVLDFPLSQRLGEHGDCLPIDKNGKNCVSYGTVVSQAIARMGEGDDDQAIPYYRAVTIGQRDREYRRWLGAAISDVRCRHAKDRRLLFVNAWNDWNRGMALEPNRVTGYSKLNETSRALLGLPSGLALPKVSVIVPNYNHAKYLPRRLESIYKQTYKNIEVLLLDDCSDDESRSVLTEFANRYPDITRVLFNQTNSGSSFRQWAKGIKAATGDLIWIAESDDYCDENFLEKLVRCFDDEAVMLAYSKVEFVRGDESVVPDEFARYVQGLDCSDKWMHSYVNTAHQEVSDAIGIINTIPNASGAIFRRLLDMALLEDEAWLSMRFAGDWVFYLHQMRGGKIAYSANTTNYFRRHDNSTVLNNTKSEQFYRELSMAAKAAQSLYDTDLSIVDKFCGKAKELYDYCVGGGEAEFMRWIDKEGILESRHSRTPNILVSTMGFHAGGAEILPIRMANEFRRQGHSVVLLNVGFFMHLDGVRRLLRRDVPVITTSDVERTKRLIHDFGIEVLNSHQWFVQRYPEQIPDVFSGLKAHVASLHGMLEHTDAFNVTLEALRIANENVTTWIYTADKNLGAFIESGLYHGNSPRFVKLPNGMAPPIIKPIRRAEIGFPDHAFVLCCVSRAIPDKGWAETIEAVRLARESTGKDIRLILVGNGPVHDDFVHSGVPSFVYLAGFHENSVGFYAAADMGIMLTKFKSESFPLTIVDCLFAGKPYIATAVGEIKNMLATEHGLAGSVVDLEGWEIPVGQVAKIIATYATDSAVMQSAQKVVPEAASRYKIDVVAKQYVSIFERDIQAWRNNEKADV